MPKICISAIIFITLCACGPARDIKKAQKLLAKAVANGAKVDSVIILIHDTLRFSAFRDLISTRLVVNPSFVVKSCQELQKAHSQRQKTKALDDLRKELCQPVNLDTTYRMAMKAQGQWYYLPLHVVISIQNGFDYRIESGGLEVPFVKQESKVNISAGYTTWQYVRGVMGGLLLGCVLGAILCKVFLK